MRELNLTMGTRIATDLKDPRLMKLLRLEAQRTDTPMKNVLINALEAYFSSQLETSALLKASERIFEEWNDPKDSDYDDL